MFDTLCSFAFPLDHIVRPPSLSTASVVPTELGHGSKQSELDAGELLLVRRHLGLVALFRLGLGLQLDQLRRVLRLLAAPWSS